MLVLASCYYRTTTELHFVIFFFRVQSYKNNLNLCINAKKKCIYIKFILRFQSNYHIFS